MSIFKRKDVADVAKKYSSEKFDINFCLEKIATLKETEDTINLLEEKGYFHKSDSDKLILNCFSYKSNDLLKIPARSCKCNHVECMNFDIYLQIIANIR